MSTALRRLLTAVAGVLALSFMAGPAQAATTIATVATGRNPEGVAVNTRTNRIYVTNRYDGTLSVIDGGSSRIVNVFGGFR